MRYNNSAAVFLALLLHSLLGYSEAVCGFEACPATKTTTINVHLVPHSHDDVGWLKTVDQYYYGSKNNIQHAGVQYILDSVVDELLKDKTRRFIFVESAFFFKWYDEQSTEMRANVKKLVDGGQLEFAGGAWSMNDEAAVHYQSVIDQFTVGLKALADTFGICGRPRVGWQIDPFGHSREMASLFAQMGYDGQFFARMDWVEKSLRLKNMTGEMIWKASENLGELAELFTGVLYNHYSAPPGFCFDALCRDEPINDGNSYDNNVQQRVDSFLEYILNMTQYYRASHIMVPMGDDFNYENAVMNFKNMDKLIKYVNARQLLGSKVNVFYSTPSCYLNALHEQPLTWPNKTQDFFPYSTDWHSYWTGYYSSRPTQKRFERDGNHFLQVAKQLTTLANLTGTEVTENLDQLRHVMGVMQHHDAITGTEKQNVANDYSRLLVDGLHSAEVNTRMALQKLTNLTAGEFANCWQLNISYCNAVQTATDILVITLFNPLAHPSYQYVRIPVSGDSLYEVRDATGRIFASELVPVPQNVLALPFRPNGTTHELVFEAYVLKLAIYYIKQDRQEQVKPVKIETRNREVVPKEVAPKGRIKRAVVESSGSETTIQNSQVKLTFSSSGHLTKVEMNGITENIRQDFFYYQAALGNNGEFKNRSSGAYIFRPNGTEVQISNKVVLTVHRGTKVNEIHQTFKNWVSQVIRIYEGVNRVEFEWLVGPIPIEDGVGKEIITRFTSTINSNGVFWTDSNGREMIRRVKNEREYFKANLTEMVSGNYYPVTARLALQDEAKRMALLTDRAQGGSSLTNGSLELMLHRRLLHDDAFGVGEALNETAFGIGLIARGKVNLILSSAPLKHSQYERLAQQQLHLPFWKFFSNSSNATDKVPPKVADFSSLPLGIQILTLEPFSANERLIRFENYMDRTESTSITFNIRAIFDNLGGESVHETTLDGSMPLGDMKRFKFQPDDASTTKVEYYTSKYTPLSAVKEDNPTKFSISLGPMQIRTFIIKWK